MNLRRQSNDLTWPRKFVWEMRLSKYLPDDYEEETVIIYQNCFDFSCNNEYNEIMGFVTKAFVERNRQLDENRTIAQVKMKFGFLTIYYDGGRDPYLDEIVNTAAKMAKQIKAKIQKQYGKGGPWNRKILQPTKGGSTS
jgi:hypothetical protein